MCSAISRKAGLHHVTVPWEDKHHNTECPSLPSSSPSSVLLSMTWYGMEYPFGQLELAVLAVSPPSFLCTTSLLTGGVVWEAEKALMLCKHFSAITKISLYYRHCFFSTNPKHRPILVTMKKRNPIPAKTSTGINCCSQKMFKDCFTWNTGFKLSTC